MVMCKHGMTKSPEYRIWANMMQRCGNPKATNFHNYGGRGIVVCESWHKFENFYADMGPRPSLKHSIDRENNDGNYEPSNCRWATKIEQCLNQRKTIDLIGHVSGRLTVIDRAEGRQSWKCQCSCGTIKIVQQGNLLPYGKTRSCGCYRAEANRERAKLKGVNCNA